MDLKNLFKDDEQYSPEDLTRKNKILENLDRSRKNLVGTFGGKYASELVRKIQAAEIDPFKRMAGGAKAALEDTKIEVSDKTLAGKKRTEALLSDFRSAVGAAVDEFGVDVLNDLSAFMPGKEFDVKKSDLKDYVPYEKLFTNPATAEAMDDPKLVAREETKENTLRDFDRFSKTKEGQILGILQDLDISNLKEKRMGNATPMQIPDPEEPGITPDEARRRRQMLLEMDPAVLSQLEKEAKLMDEMPAESPLELPLEKIKRKSRRVSPEIMERPTSIPTPTSTGG